MLDGQAINNECKISIPSGVLIKIPTQKEKISYTLVQLIIHYGYSLECGHYVSGVFDSNTGIWWHCNDDEITENNDL